METVVAISTTILLIGGTYIATYFEVKNIMKK